jgi:hypothetical protein
VRLNGHVLPNVNRRCQAVREGTSRLDGGAITNT